jgi:hypothetical protein
VESKQQIDPRLHEMARYGGGGGGGGRYGGGRGGGRGGRGGKCFFFKKLQHLNKLKFFFSVEES